MLIKAFKLKLLYDLSDAPNFATDSHMVVLTNLCGLPVG